MSSYTAQVKRSMRLDVSCNHQRGTVMTMGHLFQRLFVFHSDCLHESCLLSYFWLAILDIEGQVGLAGVHKPAQITKAESAFSRIGNSSGLNSPSCRAERAKVLGWHLYKCQGTYHLYSTIDKHVLPIVLICCIYKICVTYQSDGVVLISQGLGIHKLLAGRHLMFLTPEHTHAQGSLVGLFLCAIPEASCNTCCCTHTC